jgi:cysteine synthase
MTNRDLGVFEGPNALMDFLDPDQHPPLPLVELPDHLNPFRHLRVRILAKAMYLLPLLNLKSLPALSMLRRAKEAGNLAGVNTIIESSSGNTAVSLAVLARAFGIQRTTALVPWDIAPGKLDLLRLCGAEPRMHRDQDGASANEHARQTGSEPGHFSPGQYYNDANPAAFERWVAPELWKQTHGRLTVFATGLGSTGTLVGASRYLRRQSQKVAIVGAICKPNEAVPGVRSERRLQEIGHDWRAAADHIVEVATKPSFKYSLQICRAGILGGPSSGFALAGLLQFLETTVERSALDELRNADGEVYAVFVCADTPLPYLDKYSTHLDASDF